MFVAFRGHTLSSMLTFPGVHAALVAIGNLLKGKVEGKTGLFFVVRLSTGGREDFPGKKIRRLH